MNIRSLDKYALSGLAYSMWTGNPELYRANADNALKLLIELHGPCESKFLGKDCMLFSAHPVTNKHRWSDGANGLYWDDRPEPVTYMDGATAATP